MRFLSSSHRKRSAVWYRSGLDICLLHDARDLDLYPLLNRAKIDRLNCGNNSISNHAETASQHYIYDWIYNTVSIICAKSLICTLLSKLLNAYNAKKTKHSERRAIKEYKRVEGERRLTFLFSNFYIVFSSVIKTPGQGINSLTLFS